ncbi:MAG TPA: DUF58 domain-containing protein [Acidimicrobiales bacterium]|nr:DUF58 domain-containing protein [Acidimicrobiales bacterium]
MTPGSRRLTARGRAVLAGSAVMALSAYLFGIQELYSLAVAGGMLVLGAAVWVRAVRWDLEVARHVHPARVQAGQEARVELTIRNLAERRSPPAGARDGFDGGARWASFSIAPLAPGEVRASSYRLPSHRRGLYHLGPLELTVTDPFGLARATRDTAPDTSLTVHPRYDLVPVGAVSSHRDEDRRPLQSMIGKGGNEFYMLREYVPGDDLRRVHWPSTARLDDLIIRQPESARRGRVTLVADMRAPVHDPDTVEAVLSAVATLAVSSLRSGLQVRVVTTGGFDSGHASGRSAGVALLDGLASAETHRPGAEPFRVAGRLDPVVLVTTDRIGDPDLQAAVGLGGPHGTTVVVFESAGQSPHPAGTPSLDHARRRISVPAGASFASAWTAWENTSC